MLLSNGVITLIRLLRLNQAANFPNEMWLLYIAGELSFVFMSVSKIVVMCTKTDFFLACNRTNTGISFCNTRNFHILICCWKHHKIYRYRRSTQYN